MKERHKFWWFPHMWKHTQPHKIDNVTKISFNMQLNKAFAAQQARTNKKNKQQKNIVIVDKRPLVW